ncbi:putative Translation initiation factor eIF-2B subunit delta [Blattamonas nauphoetae]|uniref:Translation initiation factor eIF2B subunit delta n=1 Tax=Blattamonas nauphoetae TaxID=2049346 RepID=A0ABQ9Y4A2_9EUKA|nr:putative Translation initiation factor eIF-2B subunit delta [Blattamonas nauphoetae]
MSQQQNNQKGQSEKKQQAPQKGQKQQAVPKQKGGNPPSPAQKNDNKQTPPSKNAPQPSRQPPRVNLFSELVPYKAVDNVRARFPGIHPAFIEFGVKLMNGALPPNANLPLNLMEAAETLISSFNETPIHVHLPSVMAYHVRFVENCAPHSIPLNNVLQWLRTTFSFIPTLEEEITKRYLLDVLNTYKTVYMESSASRITQRCKQLKLINPGDVVLVYGYSDLALNLIVDVHNNQIPISVIVVDDNLSRNGEEMMKAIHLNAPEVQVSFVPITGISFVMPQCTIVIIEGHAILGNGYTQGIIGSGVVAMQAVAAKKSVVCLCPALNLSDHVTTDSIWSQNSLHNPSRLLNAPPAWILKQDTLPTNPLYSVLSVGPAIPNISPESLELPNSNLQVIDLEYEVIPPTHIEMVVSESGAFPPISAPSFLSGIDKDLAERIADIVNQYKELP